MAQEAKVNINIASLFTGKKAFKEADTATAKLTKSVKNLAAAFGVAFAARSIINFAKSSVKASLEAAAQQDRLARLLEVTNDASAAQIAILTRQSKALEKLGVVSATSITQVQSQLATFDLQILTINKLTPAILDYVTAEKGASATTADFKAMTNGLAQALNGNFASLTRTGFVLDDVTKELISTGTESERAAAIVKVLDSTYKGFNRSLRDTPAGQFIVLANAAERAKVIIGDGLTVAVKQAFGGGDVEKAADNMESLAFWVSATIQGLGILIGGAAKLVINTEKLTPGAQVEKAKAAKLGNTPFDPMAMKVQDLTPTFMALVKAQQKADLLYRRKVIKLEKEALTLEKKKTAELKARAKLEKANRALDMAGTIFDLDKIQLYAALQSKITDEDRDKLNLKLLLLNAENQTGAALSKSAQEATILSQKILMQNGLVMTYDGLIKNLAKAKNPFEGFDEYTKGVLESIRRIQLALDNLQMPVMGTFDITGPFNKRGGIGTTPYGPMALPPDTNLSSDPNDFQFIKDKNAFQQAMILNETTVNVNASYIANPQEIQDVVQNAIQNANRAGNSTNYAGQLGF